MGLAGGERALEERDNLLLHDELRRLAKHRVGPLLLYRLGVLAQLRGELQQLLLARAQRGLVVGGRLK